MKHKCIILSRVSTEGQDLEQQTTELFNEAFRLGYDNHHIIVIEDKESAIKLDEEHRHGLAELKHYIISDNTIDCVVCYEISRISRRQQVLYSIRDFLIEHLVQLVCIKPYFKLLENGKMSQTANIVFSMFSALAESEMTIKKERMLRGKRFKQQQGKFIGGGILFGYKTDKDNNIIIDDEKKNIVIDIFNDYANGKSCSTIGKELFELGLIPSPNKAAAKQYVQNIVSNEQYCGKKVPLHNNIYPRIISDELFERCEKQRQMQRSKPKTNISMIYYCRDIIKSKDTKYKFAPSKSTKAYRAYNKFTGQSINISINVIDSLAWHLTKMYKAKYAQTDADTAAKERKRIGEKLIKKIFVIDEKNKQLQNKIDRIENRYIEGRISESKANSLEDTIKSQLKENESVKQNMLEQLANIRNNAHDMYLNLKTDYTDILDDAERAKLIKQCITSIELSRDNNKHYTYLKFNFINGKSYLVTFYRWGKYSLIQHNNKDIKFELLDRFKL